MKLAKMSIKCYISKYNVTYSHNVILDSNENGQSTMAYDIMDDFHKQNIMWKEPDTKKVYAVYYMYMKLKG